MESMKEMFNAPLIWFVVGLVLILSEFVSPGIVLIFFGIGAWVVAGLTLILNLSINLQLLIFILCSVVFLILLREKFNAFFKERWDTQPVDGDGPEASGFIGKHAVVTREITARTKGKVEFRGTYWDAEASTTIAKDTPVKIISKDNITLFVEPFGA